MFETSNEMAVQWSSGFNIGASNGIKDASLSATFSSSAQTGYDSNAQIIYTFEHAGYACGTNHDPPKAAIVVMRGTKS
jgi:nucleoside recognition membrane protein YjiH